MKVDDPDEAVILQSKLTILRTRWNALELDADSRKTAIRDVVPKWHEFEKESEELEQWMDDVKGRLQEADDDEKFKVRECIL